jgi:hypothetical protein
MLSEATRCEALDFEDLVSGAMELCWLSLGWARYGYCGVDGGLLCCCGLGDLMDKVQVSSLEMLNVIEISRFFLGFAFFSSLEVWVEILYMIAVTACFSDMITGLLGISQY